MVVTAWKPVPEGAWARTKRGWRHTRPASVSLGGHLLLLLVLTLMAGSAEKHEQLAVITVARAEEFIAPEELETPTLELAVPEVETQMFSAAVDSVIEVSFQDLGGSSSSPKSVQVENLPSMDLLLQEIQVSVSVAASAALGTDEDPGQGSGNGSGDGLGDGSRNSPVDDGANVSFFGVKVRAKRVVYILDGSGSMDRPIINISEEFKSRYGRTPTREEMRVLSRQASSLQTKFARLFQEVSSSISGLGSSTRFGVIFFHRGSSQWGVKGGRLLPATPQSKAAVFAGILETEYGKGIEPLSVTLEALKAKPDVIYFVSDGEIGVSTFVQTVVDANVYKIPIVTIGIGRSGEDLRELSSRTGGTSVHITK